MKHILSKLLIGCILMTIAAATVAQNYFEEEMPRRLPNYPAYQQLVQQQEAMLEKVLVLQNEIQVRIPSATVRLTLDRALRILPQSRTPQIAQTFEVLRKQGIRSNQPPLDSFLNPDGFIRLEQEAIRINQEFDRLASIFQYQDSYEHYPLPQLLKAAEDELVFYGIRDGDHIGEIGAGDESFACVLAASYQNLRLYLNEVAGQALQQLRYHQLYHPVLQSNQNRVWVVEGSAVSTGLEDKQLDKVIVRNALHHFSDPDAMLQSIRQSLKPAGALFIKEKFAADCQKQCCDLLLEKQRLKHLLDEQHFEQVDSTVFQDDLGETWWLFQYRKQVN